MLIKNISIYSNKDKAYHRGDILIKNGVIADIGEQIDTADTETVNGNGLYALPGLVDVHTHGIAGKDWCTDDRSAFAHMAAEYAKHGVTTVMPTVSSAPLEQMLSAAREITAFKPASCQASTAGVHFEGRYLSMEKKGAHAPEYIKPLCAAELDNSILRECKRFHLSAAYELDIDGSFSKMAKEIGATMGLAHTMATYAEAKRAEERGVSSYTHLFNAMPSLHHRDGGCIAAAFEGDRICELICDGIHIAPEMVRLAYRALGGERLSLISDSLDATGLPDGRYFSSGLPVTVKDGICRIGNGALAGSTVTLDKAVNNLCDFCSIPLTEAIICATSTPAKQINAYDSCGSIDIGKQADLILSATDNRLTLTKIMVRGEFISL